MEKTGRKIQRKNNRKAQQRMEKNGGKIQGLNIYSDLTHITKNSCC